MKKTFVKRMRRLTACITSAAFLFAMPGAVPVMAIDSVDEQEIQICETAPLEDFIQSLDEDLYGGVYFDDNGNLCISTKDSNAEQQLRSSLRMRSNESLPNIIFTAAEYTKEELEAVKEILWASREEYDIRAIGFRDADNALSVYVMDLTPEKEQIIIDAAGMDNIIFLNYEEGMFALEGQDNGANELSATPAANITVRGGHMIQKTRGSAYTATLATSCVYPYSAGSSKWNVGILSVGHEFSQGSTVYYEGSTAIATATYAKKGNGGDFAFCKISSSAYNPHGYISTPTGANQIQAATRRTPVVGDTVYMYGRKTGRTSGKVLEVDLTMAIGSPSWTVNGVFNYSNRPEAGDSGGPIVVQNGSGWSIVGYNIAQRGTGASANGGLGVSITHLSNTYDIVPCT